MKGTTIEEYLTYIPCEIQKGERFSSSTKTTMPNDPRDLEGVEISQWTSFQDMVCETRGRVPSQKHLPPLPSLGAFPCYNEAQVESKLHLNLFQPLLHFMACCGIAGNFTPKPTEVILDPDYSWSSRKDPASKIFEPKILIEVKTFWAFDPPDDLVSVLEPLPATVPPEVKKQKLFEPELADNVRRGVSQIYGYMTVNNIRFGVIATYSKFFFLRRAKGTLLNSKIEITSVIRRNQTRECHGFTLMEAWISLILAAEGDHFFASSCKSSILDTRNFIMKEAMELCSEFTLGALWFGERIRRSQLGTVVNGGLRGLKETESVMKIVDKSKSSDMSKKLEIEVCAYRQMISLQGIIVPEVHGFLLISNWIMVLVLSHCGRLISDRQFLDHYKDIKEMVKGIHAAGVAHRDLRRSNILIDNDDKVTMIDFSEASLRSNVGATKFLSDCETDLDHLRHLKDHLEAE